MKKTLTILTVIACLTFAYGSAFAGNGIPSGKSFLVNIMGYNNCPTGDFIDSNRRMIAVKASYAYNPAGVDKSITVKTNTIGLVPGADFAVLDGNACNKGGAQFMLPTDVATTYQVYVRLVGKPGTGIDVTSCADEAVDVDGDGIVENIVMCSTESVIEIRSAGKPVVKNVTTELLTLCLDTTGDGVCDTRYNLFDPRLEDYFWQWNTTGKAHAQLIFVPIN
jgi:hypothetical protein